MEADKFDFDLSVNSLDQSLKNAIELGSPEIVAAVIEKGANVSCQYPQSNWSSPLHLAIELGFEAIVELLMSHKPNYALIDGKNQTPAELALGIPRLKALGRKMIEAEFGEVDPVKAIYELLKRSSVEAVQVLFDLLAMPRSELIECLAKAWSKLEVMNVEIDRRVELFAHMTLIEFDYEDASRHQHLSDAEVTARMCAIVEAIDLVEQKYDTGLCHDVNDEFMELLRVILRNLFRVKNRFESFPAMQLEFCVAIFIAIIDRRPEMEVFQFVINKCLIVDFLKMFRKYAQTKDTRINLELLMGMIKVLQRNYLSKFKRIVLSWKSVIGNTYRFKEQLMLKNRLLNNPKIMNINEESTLTTSEVSFLHQEVDAINRMFTIRKIRSRCKTLLKTYFKLKQLYSLQKCTEYLKIVVVPNWGTKHSQYVTILAVQRAIQVLGESLKSTKLSPNISSNLRSWLEFISPGQVFNRVLKLRQFYSHEYGTVKHSLYDRARKGELKLAQHFNFIQEDLSKVLPMLDNLRQACLRKYLNSFLGQAFLFKKVSQINSLAEYCRVSRTFHISGVSNFENPLPVLITLGKLETCFDKLKHRNHFKLLNSIRKKILKSLDYFKSFSNERFTELVRSGIGIFMTNNRLDYLRNYAKFVLSSNRNPYQYEFGLKVAVMYICNPELQQLLQLEIEKPDDSSATRMEILKKLQDHAETREIDQLHRLTVASNSSTTEFTQEFLNGLDLQFDSEDLLQQLDKRLAKYYTNLFEIDEKYRTLAAFCKLHKIAYPKEKAVRCRTMDLQKRKKVFNLLLEDLRQMSSLPRVRSDGFIPYVAALADHKLLDRKILAFELVLLDVLEILSNQGVLQDNASMLSYYRPVISGRNLRNYLAHDGFIYETICKNRNSFDTLLLNAAALVKFGDRLLNAGRKIDPKAEVSISTFNVWFAQEFKLKTDHFNDKECLNLVTFEYKARDCHNRSVLEKMIDKQSENFIHLLMGRPSHIGKILRNFLVSTPNQNHNLYDDWKFSVREIFDNANLRSCLDFYLALKHHHFELEEAIDRLRGGAYEADSLQLACMFKNEKSALGIINSSHWYKFCRGDSSQFSETVLTRAVLCNLPAVVKRICEVDSEMVCRTNSAGETALYSAVVMGSLEIVKILCAFGSLAHTSVKSPLIYAVDMRKDDIVEELLASEQEFSKNQEMLTILVQSAASSNHHKLLERLLPMIKSRKTVRDALIAATRRGHLESTLTILENNPSTVNEVDQNGQTALYHACFNGSRAVVKALLQYGAGCCIPSDDSALEIAIHMNRTRILKIFISEGNINQSYRECLFETLFLQTKTKLAWMVFKAGFPWIVQNSRRFCNQFSKHAIRELFLKMCQKNSDCIRQVTVEVLVETTLQGDLNFLEFFVDKIELNARDLSTLINCAMKTNKNEAFNLLKYRGCNFDCADSSGITPLGFAVDVGKPDFVKAIVKLKANPNTETMGQCDVLTAGFNLFGLSHEQNIKKTQKVPHDGPMCDLLWSGPEDTKALDAVENAEGAVRFAIRAVVNSQKERWLTFPVTLAAFKGHIKILQFLLQNGALPDPIDTWNLTPLIGALLRGNLEIARLLVQCGANMEHVRRFRFPEGETVLHAVVSLGFTDCCRLLVEENTFDCTVLDDNRNSPLHLAVKNNRIEELHLLRDTNWNHRNNAGDTAIMAALKQPTVALVQLLTTLPHGVKIIESFEDSLGRSVLHYAAQSGSTELVEYLLHTFKLDVNWIDYAGKPPIYFAIKRNFESITKLLLQFGAVLYHSKFKKQPIVLAIQENQINTIQYFFDINPTFKQNLEGCFPDLVEMSISFNNSIMTEILIKFLDYDIETTFKDGNSLLQSAVFRGSVELVEVLLNLGCNIDRMNIRNQTALLSAMIFGNWRVAEFLLARRCLIQEFKDFRFQFGATLLHQAADIGSLQTVKILIKHKILPECIRDCRGRTVAHYAAEYGQLKIIEYLIEQEFPFDLQDDQGQTALSHAVAEGQLAIARRLREYGASLNGVLESKLYADQVKREEPPSAAMRKAIESGSISEVQQLISNASVDEPDENGRTLLHHVCESNNLEMVQLLLSHGATIDKPDHGGVSPLIICLLNGHRLLTELLIDQGASLDKISSYRLPTDDEGTVLHEIARKGFTSTLDLILNLDVFEVDIGDRDHTTALQVVAMYDNTMECAKLLVKNGANINFVDRLNSTALTRAFSSNQETMVRFLIAQGAQIEPVLAYRLPGAEGYSLLHLAVFQSLSMVDLLLEEIGIPIDVLDSMNRTALFLAVHAGNNQLIDHLLFKGAQVDNLSKSPLVLAVQMKNLSVAEKMLSKFESVSTVRCSQTQKSLIHLIFNQEYFELIDMMLFHRKLDRIAFDTEGRTVLHYAASSNNLSVFKQFLKGIDDLFVLDNSGISVFQCFMETVDGSHITEVLQFLNSSVRSEHLTKFVKQLGGQCSDVFMKAFVEWLWSCHKEFVFGNGELLEILNSYYGGKAMIRAISEDDANLTEILFSAGDNPFEEVGHGFPPHTTLLHIAALKNSSKAASLLIKVAKIPVDCRNFHQQTPLSLAASSKGLKTAKLLLTNGANIDLINDQGKPPLVLALETDYLEMVQLLLTHGSNLGILKTFRYDHPTKYGVLHMLAVESKSAELLARILPSLDPNCEDLIGRTPLHYAAQNNSVEVIQFLLEAGSNLHHQESSGATPLIRAIAQGHLEAYRTLLNAGADSGVVQTFRNRNFNHESVLHVVAERGHLAMMKILVEELGCELDVQDDQGNTPLHLAVKAGELATVKYLLSKNASIGIRNNEGIAVYQLLEAVDYDVERYGK
ncbi:uncharacterized protein LOC129752655 [Uranotaenia lowii]|uniref:uncharacterized protein LOC129752655 n=1 Tax=Uranotaenia lowii TaxID=190385 RepID=UPI002478B722|nr:uncharacterized protein LOC129752655 [Uranotaenia lowii]